MQEAWNSIEQSTIDKLVAGLDERLAKVEAAGGAWIRDKAQ